MKFEQQDIIQSLIDYGDYYNQSRAIPSIKDGLKPSQRKLLYMANKIGLRSNKGTRKLTQLTGATVDIYHHGESALQETAIRMGQAFKMGNTVFDIEGNYGSQATVTASNAGAAAARYLSLTTTELGDMLTSSIQDDTATFIKHQEDPVALWSDLPGFLLFAQKGIGVGTATSIPAFTMTSVQKLTAKLIEQDGVISNHELAEILVPEIEQQPILINKKDMEGIFSQRGEAKSFRYVAQFDTSKDKILTITNFPFEVSPDMVIKDIYDKIEDVPIFDNIVQVQDTSKIFPNGETKVSMDLYLKKQTDTARLIEELRRHTSLESVQSVNLTLVNDKGKAQEYTYPEALYEWYNLFVETNKQRLSRKKDSLAEKISRKEAEIQATLHMDKVVDIIKESEDKRDAIFNVGRLLEIHERHAEKIVNMPLSSLTKLSRRQIEQELRDLMSAHAEVKSVLNSKDKMKQALVTQVAEIKTTEGRGVHMTNDILAKPTFELDTNFYVTLRQSAGKGQQAEITDTYMEHAIHGDMQNPVILYYGNRARLIDRAQKGRLRIDNVWTVVTRPFYYHIGGEGMVKGTDSTTLGSIKDREVVGWDVTHVVGSPSSVDGYLLVTTNQGKVQVPISKIPLTQLRHGAKGVKLVNLRDDEEILEVEYITTPDPKINIGRAVRTSKTK